MTGTVRGLVAGLVVAAVIAGCYRAARDRRVTGTCAGACAWYLDCKSSDDPAARDRCLAECPEVFGDETSLGEFEQLECKDAIEYVDGVAAAPVHASRDRRR